MSNEQYRLQLRSHREVFTTREEAVRYMEDNYRHIALFGEPALFFYGDEKNPSMILAVGSTVNRKLSLCTIDDTELRELIAAVSEEAGKATDDVKALAARLLSTIKAAGLVLDENKKENQVTYEPGNADALIKNAESISEAVSIISKFVQDHVAESELTTEDSKSVKLIYKKNGSDGATLKAKVILSGDGDDDDLDFNNNIIGIKKDGLFASVNIEYDEERHRLIFTTSGTDKNGRYKDDANKKVIDFGEHSKYTADNEDHNVKVTINQENQTISADIKISEDDDNGIVVKDGKLYVSMRAKDIKYKNTTVAAKLNSIDDEIAGIKETVAIVEKDGFIKGEQTDTMETTAKHEQNGGYTISSDVRLSNDGSIIVKEGGLSVKIDIAVDKTTNVLTLTVGNEKKTVSLPGVDIIEDMYYDSANKVLVIKTSDGKTITIPVGDMLTTWIVNNPATSPVTLTKATGEAGSPDVLSANLKLASTDNILKVDTYGNLVAPKSEITDAVAAEATRAQSAEKTNADAIAKEVEERTEAVTENASAIANNAAAIANEASERELADTNLDAKIAAVAEKGEDNKEAIEKLEAKVDEKIVIVDGIDEKFAEVDGKIAANATAIEKEISDREAADTTLTNATAANAAAIDAEKVRAAAKEAELTAKDETLAGAITNEVTRAQGQEDALKDRVTVVEQDIVTLRGGENTDGSMVSIAKHYADDVKAALDNEVERAKSAEDDIKVTVAENKATAKADSDAALADAKHYTDDEILKLGDTVDAKFVSEKAEITDAYKAYTDEKAGNAETSTKAYTDEKVAAEKEAREAADAAINEKVAGLTEAQAAAEEEIAKKIEKVAVVKNGELQYFITVDGVNVGEINIPKDQFLKSVDYADGKLHFVFVTTDGDVETNVDISSLIDTYTAGDGLTLTDNKFAVRLNEDSDEFLFVTEEGIAIKGLKTALDAKADKTDLNGYYTKDEADGKYLTEHQDISGKADKTEVEAVADDVTTLTERVAGNESAIAVLNGNEAQEGSVKKALADAKAYADEKVAAEAETARAAEKTNADAIAVLNGNEAQEGSVKKAVKVAKEYADAAVAEEKTARELADANLAADVAKKANSADVYTKTEADTIFVKASDASTGYATKSELTEEVSRAKAAEKANADAIDALGVEVDKKVEKVEVVKNSANDLQYIVKVDGNEVGTIDIPKDQFLKDVVYDSNTKVLKFTFVTTDDTSKEVSIEISDLVDTYTAGEGLTLADNKFSVKVDPHTQSYISVSENGIEIVGIDEALAKKADKTDVEASFETVNDAIVTETERAKAAEKANADAITGLTGSLSSEVARATAAEDLIKSDVASNKAAIDLLNGNADEVGSVREIAKHVADDAAAALAAEVTRAQAAEKANADAIAALTTSTSEATTAALAEAKAYTDAEKTRAEGVEATIKADVAANSEAIGKKVEKVELKQSAVNPLVYTLFVDGTEAGKVNIPKDQFLKDVKYDADTKSLKFTFVTTDDESKEVSVSVADLVDTYEAGNGLKLDGNKFEVTVDPSTQSYVEVTEYGIKVNGIDEALALKADANKVYTKDEADAKFLTEHQSLADYAKAADLEAAETAIAGIKTTADKAAADIAILNGNSAQEGSVLNAIKQSKDYADSLITTEQTARAEADAKHTADIDKKANAEDVYTKAEIDAKGYITQHQDISGKADKTYVDSELAKKVENVKLEQGDTSLIYKLVVDGTVRGTINIPKDQFLKDASYDSGNKELIFVFQTDGEDKTVKVSVADLVDTYTAGNGLKVENNEFSVVINEDSESYLKLTAEGLKIVGIDAALAGKADADKVYTKTEVDALIPDTEELSKDITANKAAIEVLNGNEATDGSVKKALADAKAYTDTTAAGYYTKEESDGKYLTEHQDISGKADKTALAAVEEKVDANTAAIAVINGNEAQEGSVKKALADAKLYADEKVAPKADKQDVYTKTEIDNKGFLTQHQDISGKADTTALDAEVLRAKNAEDAIAADVTALASRMTTAESDIDAVEADVAANKIVAEETNSVKLTTSREATGTTLSADVKVDNTAGNIIKVNGNGIYADAGLEYNKATNTLTFTAGGNSQSFELSEHTLVNNGYYDSTTQEIVLSITTADGAKEVRIKVADLIHTLSVTNPKDNPVVLAVEHGSDGDVLSARLNISTEKHNLILTDNGTLYASNQAKDHTGLWAGEEKTLQEIIELLNTGMEDASEVAADVAQLKSDMTQTKLDIVTTKNSVENLENRVTTDEAKIAENTGVINTIATQMNSLSAKVEGAMEKFEELEETVESYKTRVTTLEAAVVGLNNTINDVKEDIATYKAATNARLAAIEEIVNNLIDFGSYDF